LTILRVLALSLLLAPLGAVARHQPQPAPPSRTPATARTPTVESPRDINIVISGEAGRRNPIAIPVPIAPLGADVQSKVVDPFFTTLTDDLGSSPAFLVADHALYPKGLRPPATREEADAWIASSAQYLLDTRIQQSGPSNDQVEVIAQVYDLRTLRSVLGRSYRGEQRAARKIAHTLANDIVRQFTGKPGPFLTKIAFVSDRDEPRVKEVYVMDFDGQNPVRLTYNRSLSLAPDWSPDSTRLVYQFYQSDAPHLAVMSRDGTDKRVIPTSTGLNSSPSWSSDGRTIAFCGSVKGNTEIFTVGVDGSNLKRLTDNAAIDSTPRWSPNGREIAFTSNRQGQPQIYLMDLEGANVRRVTFAGNWNDEAVFSPDGGRIAYACRNEGDMQICVTEIGTGRTLQISNGPGAHENPTWSPEGSRIAWEVTRGSSTQIMVANADGSGTARQITSQGNNLSPAWSKTLE
jgi:TolB protein